MPTLYGKAFKEVDAPTLEAMGREPWRGNVRELENRIERAVLMSPGSQLDPILLVNGDDVLPPSTDDAVIKPGLSVRGMEKILICKTMQAVNHNRARASELLGISVRTLRNKLNEYKAAQVDVKGEVLS
jgi:two-component system response regulator AtoC